jgi:hypothetical protein
MDRGAVIEQLTTRPLRAAIGVVGSLNDWTI